MTAPKMKWEWSIGNVLTIAVMVIGLSGQAAFGVWWLAKLEARIDASDIRISSNAAEIATLEVNADRMGTQVSGQAVQLGRIEEQILGLRSDFNRLFNVLERNNP